MSWRQRPESVKSRDLNWAKRAHAYHMHQSAANVNLNWQNAKKQEVLIPAPKWSYGTCWRKTDRLLQQSVSIQRQKSCGYHCTATQLLRPNIPEPVRNDGTDMNKFVMLSTSRRVNENDVTVLFVRFVQATNKQLQRFERELLTSVSQNVESNSPVLLTVAC